MPLKPGPFLPGDFRSDLVVYIDPIIAADSLSGLCRETFIKHFVKLVAGLVYVTIGVLKTAKTAYLCQQLAGFSDDVVGLVALHDARWHSIDAEIEIHLLFERFAICDGTARRHLEKAAAIDDTARVH